MRTEKRALARPELIALLLLASCASPPPPALPAPPPAVVPPEPAPLASIELGPPRYRDLHRIKLPALATLGNPGTGALRLEALEWALLVEGAVVASGPADFAAALPGGTLGPGASVAIPLGLELGLGGLDGPLLAPGGPSRAAYRVELRAALSRGDQGIAAGASAEGVFPIVREPRFRITSIRILRDILVTTELGIGLEAENPNDFPLELRSLSYRFYGEGKAWASGSLERPVALPPGRSGGIEVEGAMNFADMDRRLFDLVAALRSVRYRITGGASLATGIEALPAFEASFDESGACAVER